MVFSSLDALREELGIPSELTELEELRSELQRRRAAIHPDRNGGIPVSSEAEQKFQRLSDAITYLDELPRGLQRIDPRMRAIENRIVGLQSAIDAMRSDQTAHAESVRIIKSDVAHRYRGSLISSGSVAAVCGAILAFSERLPANPVFAPVAESRSAKLTILVGFLVAGAAFVWTWIREHLIEEKTKWLLTDDGLTSIVRGCIREPDKEEPNTRITKRQIVHEILYFEYPWHKIEFIRRIRQRFLWVRVPDDLAEQIAEIHVRALLARGVVRREGLKGLEPLFVMDAARAKEIANER